MATRGWRSRWRGRGRPARREWPTGRAGRPREPAAPSALWHSLASARGSAGRPRASRTATEKAALDERPAPTGIVLVTRSAPPDGGWARAMRAAASTACGGGRGGVAQRDLPRLGVLVAGHADQEAARLGGEGGLGGQVDGHGEREALVVVGVVADQGDPSGRAGDEHRASLTPMRPLGSRSCHGADIEKRTAQRYQDHRAGGDRALPLTPAMMLADAGAQVIRLERAAPGAPGTCGGGGRRATGTSSTGAVPRWGST